MKSSRNYSRICLPFALFLLVLSSGFAPSKKSSEAIEADCLHASFLDALDSKLAFQLMEEEELPQTNEENQEIPQLEEVLDEEIPQAQEVESQESNETLPQEVTENVISLESAQESQELITRQVIHFAGVSIPYTEGGTLYGQSIIDDYRYSMASSYGGAAHQSASDGQGTHFIGHNPGVFTNLLSVKMGEIIAITDASGTTTNYQVNDIRLVNEDGFDVNSGEDLYYRILEAGDSERVTFQTCVDDLRLIVFADLQ